jgi:hypothetical protein
MLSLISYFSTVKPKPKPKVTGSKSKRPRPSTTKPRPKPKPKRAYITARPVYSKKRKRAPSNRGNYGSSSMSVSETHASKFQKAQRDKRQKMRSRKVFKSSIGSIPGVSILKTIRLNRFDPTFNKDYLNYEGYDYMLEKLYNFIIKNYKKQNKNIFAGKFGDIHSSINVRDSKKLNSLKDSSKYHTIRVRQHTLVYSERFVINVAEAIKNKNTHIFIPVALDRSSDDVDKNYSHANLLVIYPRQRKMTLYEPHGKNDTAWFNRSKPVIRKFLKTFPQLRGYNDTFPPLVCPITNVGPQAFETTTKDAKSGFCMIFTLLFTVYTVELSHKNLSPLDIVNRTIGNGSKVAIEIRRFANFLMELNKTTSSKPKFSS